ncbi:MAG TPA: hypothetical protein VMU02_08490 [bacterium]|nr:hypothetical protein [bacterium]
MRYLLTAAFVLVLAASAYPLQHKAIQMREDFGAEPIYDCYMNYYYYIPCTQYSWFWMYTGWHRGDMVGAWFTVGDPSMGRTGSGCPPYAVCDPCGAHLLEQFRVLDFAGYGTVYDGLYTVNFAVWCADRYGCPVGPPMWQSGPEELCTAGWNYVPVTPMPCLSLCSTQQVGNLKCYPRFLITATMIGLLANYPAWGTDNISTPLMSRCAMHDNGCCPALYPRPAVSHYPTMHSGYYGVNFSNCPPTWLLDTADTVGNLYGYVELAWRVYLRNTYTRTEPSTWGSIKSIYK